MRDLGSISLLQIESLPPDRSEVGALGRWLHRR